MTIALNRQISIAFNTTNIIDNWIWGFIEPYNITYDDLCSNSVYIIKQIAKKINWSWLILNKWLVNYAIRRARLRPDHDYYQYENLVVINNFTRFLIRQQIVKHDDSINNTISISNIENLMETFKSYRTRINTILNQYSNRTSRSQNIINLTNEQPLIICPITNNSNQTSDDGYDDGYDSMPELMETLT